MKAEIQRRQSNTAKVIEVFRLSPGVWILWTVFAAIAGDRGYRTRISNAKKVFTVEGGTLESRTVYVGLEIRTEYRYLPHDPLGRDASTPVADRWPVFGAPYEKPFTLTPPEADGR